MGAGSAGLLVAPATAERSREVAGAVWAGPLSGSGASPFSEAAFRAAIWRPLSLSMGTPVRTIAAVAGRKVANPTTVSTMPMRRVQVPIASTHSNRPALVIVARSAP